MHMGPAARNEQKPVHRPVIGGSGGSWKGTEPTVMPWLCFLPQYSGNLSPLRVMKSPIFDQSDCWLSRLVNFLVWPGPHPSPPPPPLTAWSCSVSTDHGVLRGPICDADRRLWSLLPRPDHVGGDLRRAMEVTVLLKPQRWGFHPPPL